jgi:hypothetical protein
MFVLLLLFIIVAALFLYHAVADESGLPYSPSYDGAPPCGGSMNQ